MDDLESPTRPAVSSGSLSPLLYHRWARLHNNYPEGTIHPFSSGTYHQYSEDRPILDSKPSLSCSKSQAGFLGVYPHHTEGSRERC